MSSLQLRVVSLGLALLSFSAVASAQPKTFENDGNHTRIRFVASTLLFDVDGWFDKYSLNIKGDPDAIKDVAIKVEIDAASINTPNSKRDEHLRSPDFFDVAKHPKLTFVSTKVAKKGNDGVTVEGDLTIHGVTKKVKLTLKSAKGKNAYGTEQYTYRGSLKINRKDFALGEDSIAAKISLKDEVVIELAIAGFFK